MKMIAKKNVYIISVVITSILLLILLCILVLINNKNFRQEYVLEIGLPHDNLYEETTGCSLKKILSFRTFKSYSLNSDEQHNNRMFKQIQSEVHRIVTSKDGKNGVNVKFNMKTKYEDVVRILDICQIEDPPFYILKDYDIWIMAGSNAELTKNCPSRFPKP